MANNPLGERDIPQELKDQMFATFRQKLPAEVTDAVIYDIMQTNQEITKNYFISLQSQQS